MTDEGGFLTRSTSAPGSETVLTPELIDQWVESIANYFGYDFYPAEHHYIVSPSRYKEIMASPELRCLYGVKDERTDGRVQED